MMITKLFQKSSIKSYLRKEIRKSVIVSGGAHGADAMAERYAKERGYHLVVFEAEWERLGKKAGPARNEQMHKFISQFPDSRDHSILGWEKYRHSQQFPSFP